MTHTEGPGRGSYLQPPAEALVRKHSSGLYLRHEKNDLLGRFLLEDLLIQYAVTSWEGLTEQEETDQAGQEG